MNSIGQVGLTFMLTALGLALIGAIFTGKITVSVDGVQIGDRGIVDLSSAEFPITVSSTLDADQVSVGIGVEACGNNEVWKGNGTAMECGTVAGGGGSSAFSLREDTVQATSAASGLDVRPGLDLHHTDGNDTILTVDVSEFSTTESGLESILTDATDVHTNNDTDFINEDDLATSDWGHVRIFDGFAIVEDVTTSAIGQITDIGSGIRSGSDSDLITGTAGGNGTCAEWNADGDLVEAASGAACGTGSGGGGGGGGSTFWTFDTPTGTDPVVDTASDTLTWLSPSSTIAITGDSSADSISLDVTTIDVNACVVAASDAPAEQRALAGYAADGTADDVEINQALSDCEWVQLTWGTYNVTDTDADGYAIVLNNGNRLSGMSRMPFNANTALVGTEIELDDDLIDVSVVGLATTSVRFVHLDNFWIDGRGDNQNGTTSHGIHLDWTGSSVVNARRFVIEHVGVNNTQTDGFFFDQPAGLGGGVVDAFDTLSIQAGRYGLNLEGADGVFVNHKSFNSDDDGIRLGTNSGNTQFVGGFSKNNTGDGVHVVDGGNRTAFTAGFTMQDNQQYGAYVDRNDVTFNGAMFDTNGLAGGGVSNLKLTETADDTYVGDSIFVWRSASSTIAYHIDIDTNSARTNITGGRVDENAVTGDVNNNGTNTLIAHLEGCDACTFNEHEDTTQYGFTLVSPEIGTTILPAWTAFGATINDINCIVDPSDDAGDTVVIFLEERDSTADNPAGLDGSTTITCDGDGASDDGSLSNGTIDQNDYWSIVVTSTSGTISNLTVNGTYSVTRSAAGIVMILLALLAWLYVARRRGVRA